MRVIIAHNFYKIKGGEDVVVALESKQLAEHGCDVDLYFADNDEITSFLSKIKTILNTSYSRSSYRTMLYKIQAFCPDIVHVHNFFPLFSPSVFDACKKKKVASVFTLHNYRTICPTALLMWQGKICEKSLMTSAYWAVPKKVYRNSLIGTLALAHMIEYHKRKGTWSHSVDRFICLTKFSKNKFVEAGFPESKISVKPNFIPDPGYERSTLEKSYCVFIGRLSKEKGLDIALDAWKNLDFPLKVIGEGDEIGYIPDFVKMMGLKNKDEVITLLKGSLFLVIPSVWYEGFPIVILEAFACGVPVVCSRLGSLQEIVEDGYTGLHFEAGNSLDLAEKVQWMVDHPKNAVIMGENARQEYLKKYTPEKNYYMLREIYKSLI